MSGARGRTVAIKIAVEEVENARRKLESLGADGQKALDRIGMASAAAQPGMQKLAGASDAAAHAIGGFASAVPGAERAAGVLSAGLTSAAAGYAAVGIAAAAAIVGVVRAGDAMTANLARLASATGSMESAQRIYQSLFELSQQTGVSVADSAASFTRFSVAAKEVGATNTQVLGLVKTLQQAGIVAGASTEETKSAVTQLGQALASGVLQGDELRSLLENMPQLAQKLATELGVGIGELRKMGAEGQLTADKVLPALLRAGESINAEFAKMPVTMSRGFDVLGGAMVQFAERLDKALGLSQAIAKAAMAAASAVNGVTARVLPNEMQAADQAVAAARAKIAQMDAQSADGRGADPLPQFGQRRGADAVTDVRGARQKAEQDLRDSLQHQAELRRQAREDERAEKADANQQALAAQREADSKKGDKLRESLDAEAKARREHADNIAEINRLEMAGTYSSTEATNLRGKALEKLTEVLNKATEAQRSYAGGINFDTGLLTVTESDDKAIKAAQKIFEADDAKRKTLAAILSKDDDKARAEAQRTTDDVVRYAGDRFADLFSTTGKGWAGLWDSMRQTAVATAARIGAEAVIRPIVMPIVTQLLGSTSLSGGGAGMASGGGGLGGIGQMLGLSNIGEQLGLPSMSSLFGGGGGLGSLSGLLGSTAIAGWSTGSLAATNAALGGMGGLLGPATAGQVGTAATGLGIGSGATFGSLLGGVGAGFGAGTMLGNLLNPTHGTGSMIGAGGGALAGAAIGSIVPGIGTLIGGLIGGLAGGAGGSFFGPGKKHHGWSWQVQGNGADGIGLGDRVFVDEIAQQQFAQEQAQMAHINSYLKKNGISASGLIEVGGNNNNPNQVGSLNAGFGGFRFSAANDSQLNGVLKDRSFAGLEDFGKAVDFVKVTLPALLHPISAFDDQMKKLTTTFDDALTQARDYGTAEDELTAKRAERVADATATRDSASASITAGYALRYARATGGNTQAATLAGFDAAAIQEKLDLKSRIMDLGLADTAYAADRILDIERTLAAERLQITKSYADQSRGLLESLTIGGASALAPEQKYFAGLTLLNDARRTLDGGGAVEDFARVAQQVLPIARDYLGTSERYAALAADVSGAVTARTGDPTGLGAILQAQVDSTSGLVDVLAGYQARSLDVASATLSELRRLASTMEALIARKTAA